MPEPFVTYKLPGCVMFFFWSFAGCAVYPLIFGRVDLALGLVAVVWLGFLLTKWGWWADDVRLARKANRRGVQR